MQRLKLRTTALIYPFSTLTIAKSTIITEQHTHNNTDQIKSAEPLQKNTVFYQHQSKHLYSQVFPRAAKSQSAFEEILLHNHVRKWITLGIHLERSPCFPTSCCPSLKVRLSPRLKLANREMSSVDEAKQHMET